MPKTPPTFDLSSYTPVAERIRLFYERFPEGRLVTELVSSEAKEGATVVTFRALAFRGAQDIHPAATGWAAERDDDGEVNAVACVENAETSAIGRALANLGFAASVRPSREEMAKAERARAHLRERTASALKVVNGRADPATSDELRGPANRDSVVEVLSLVDELARLDAQPRERFDRVRHRLERTRPTIASLTRLARLLRRRLAALDES